MFEPHKSLHCSFFRMSRSCRHDCRLIIEGINLSVRVERGTVSQGTKRVGDRDSTLTLSKHDSVAIPLTVAANSTPVCNSTYTRRSANDPEMNTFINTLHLNPTIFQQ